MNEVEVSRRLRHKGEETPTQTPMCDNGNPYRSRQKDRSPGYSSLFFVLDGSSDIVDNVIFLIVRNSRMLLWRIVHEEVPEAVPVIICDKSIFKEPDDVQNIRLVYVLMFSKDTHQITPNKDVTWKDAPQPKELLMAAHRG